MMGSFNRASGVQGGTVGGWLGLGVPVAAARDTDRKYIFCNLIKRVEKGRITVSCLLLSANILFAQRLNSGIIYVSWELPGPPFSCFSFLKDNCYVKTH